jgi:hypothetical protein
VRTFCAEQCSKLSGGDAKNCVTPCQRDEADASDLNCGQVHHTPITSSCDEVLEFCAAKRCRLLKGIFRDACNAQCPVTVAEKNRLQCAFPADGAAKGVRYGPPPAAHCSEVASHCARQCAEMAPGDQANCSAMCPKIHAAMSHLACP